jgi:hypothetical protein
VWFRGKDLRVSDHAPLRDAVRHGAVIPLLVLDPFFFAPKRRIDRVVAQRWCEPFGRERDRRIAEARPITRGIARATK